MTFTVTCRKCNRKVPTNEVRIQADRTYMCFACSGFEAHKENTPFAHDRSAQSSVQKVRYQCAKCKYEFSLKETHAKKCPYCNSERIEEKRGMAQKLIDLHVPSRDE